jgi:hypothetical protein
MKLHIAPGIRASSAILITVHVTSHQSLVSTCSAYRLMWLITTPVTGQSFCAQHVHLYVHLCEFPVIHQHLSKQSHRFSPNANFIIWMWIGGPPSVHVNSLLPLQHGSLLVPRHHSSPASDAHCFVAIAVVLLPFPSMALLPSLDQISTGLLLQLLISTLTLPSCLHCLTNFSVNVSTDTRHSFFLFLFLRIGYESL